MKNTNELKNMANAIRFLAIDAVNKASSGHPGMPMGMADVATVLFSEHININPDNPKWPNRDRFILSAGHGSMLHYALNFLVGYKDISIEDIKNFRQLNSVTMGHPEYGHTLGVETTTGPLGQGLSTAVGMAVAQKYFATRFGKNLVDHYTYVISGDGCLAEGISQEAIDMAGHLKLSKLILFWDDNEISIDGHTSVSTSTNQIARFKASNWNTIKIDGHNYEEINEAIIKAKKSTKPTLIACKTQIGFGSPNLAGTHDVHGAPLGEEEANATRKALGWSHKPFEIPNDIIKSWECVKERGIKAYNAWNDELNNSPKKKKFEETFKKDLSSLNRVISSFKKEVIANNTKVATRKASQMALEAITKKFNFIVGGSADLTGSNLTKTPYTASITRTNFKGRYLHYGIREHVMGAMMNGLSLYGGIIPYGGTFLIFSDFMKGSIRLSALMKQRVIYVLTHDSIGLGEDGPTHQPIEQVATLRATPNINVYRPCDVVETAEAWECALMSENTPSALALSRQGLPLVRFDKKTKENKVALGAYKLKNIKNPDITLLASGSEVELALKSAQELANDGIKAEVVSFPCFEKFNAQSKEYQDDVLGNAPRIAIEAMTGFGWHQYLDRSDVFIGMTDTFGASAPIDDLYKHFNITTENIVTTAKKLIK